ncbi:hypothetical protein [Vibrio parahaemolyticus]|uniref:hypothetical protein n=1 Tax=Vibrio parahaemolyticus TaxID=670 RepID=UPI00235FDE28|nr:hypothetical protein [Vibrio parahaemolyticus]
MNIDVQIAGSWPDSESHIPTALVNNIVTTFMEMVNKTSFPKLLILNEPNRDCPMANFDKIADDRTLIFLSSVKGNLWSKIAYQLSHELCHVHANFADQRGHVFKWLEESLCELASFCNMLKMSEDWEHSAPLPFMSSYAPSLNDYVQNMLVDIPQQDKFAEWLEENFQSLKMDSCIRNKNSIIALHLMPIFLRDNTAWKAVGYINKWPVNPEDSLQDYFSSWEIACPDELKPVVQEIGKLLGA